VHPGLIAQPEFPFLPAGLKIARINDYHRLRRELAKTQEAKLALELADKTGL